MGSIPKSGTYSASRCSALFGLNQYQTPFEAWQTIMEERKPGFNDEHGYRLPDKPDNAAIRFGHAFEDAVIMLAEENEHSEIIDRERYFEKTFGDVKLSCHIDGVYADGETIHEGKTTNQRAYTSQRTEIIDSLDENDELEKDFAVKRKWGEPGTDQVPEEYQIQTAIQRICSDIGEVKLSVLVFPKSADEFEAEGVEAGFYIAGDWFLKISKGADQKIVLINKWANVLSQMGNFHTYTLPKNDALETGIIESVQKFHNDYVITEIPPPASNYDDIKRLVTRPMGTVMATTDLKALAMEYSELTRQLGKSGQPHKRREKLKVDIMNIALATQKESWTEPAEKLVILDPDGGAVLATFGIDKNGKTSFRSKRA